MTIKATSFAFDSGVLTIGGLTPTSALRLLALVQFDGTEPVSEPTASAAATRIVAAELTVVPASSPSSEVAAPAPTAQPAADKPKRARTSKQAEPAATPAPAKQAEMQTGWDLSGQGSDKDDATPAAAPTALVYDEVTNTTRPAHAHEVKATPAPAAAPPSAQDVEDLASKQKLYEVLDVLVQQRRPANLAELTAMCMEMKALVPVLSRIADLPERIARTCEVRQITFGAS